MKTSLPGFSETLDQRQRDANSASLSSNNRSARATGYEADDERTRTLQGELQETAQPPQPAHASTGRLQPVQKRNQAGHHSTSRGRRRSAHRQESQPSKGQRDELRTVAELAINASPFAGPATGGYDMHEVPGWYDYGAIDMNF